MLTQQPKNRATAAAPAIDPQAILSWIQQLRAAMRTPQMGELFRFEDVDVTDALLTPIYLTALNALRSAPSSAPRGGKRLLSRLRNWFYWRKVAFQNSMAARHSASVEPTEVLFWPRDVTHSTILLPVAAALRKQGVSCRFLCCHPRIFHLVRFDEPTAVHSAGAWPNLLRERFREGERRAEALAALPDWPFPPFDHPRADAMQRAVRAVITEMMPEVAVSLTTARQALDTFKPHTLVVGNDLTFEGRGACLQALDRAIPSVVFMHGSITSDVLQSQHLANQVVVFGEIHRQELVERGLKAEKIAVCGAPNLDQRREQSGCVHPLLQARLGLKPGEQWILVTTSGPGNRISHQHHEQVIANLMRLSARMPDLPIVIKLHRKDRLQYYQAGLRECADSKLYVITCDAHGFPYDVYEWLQGCSLVLTGASTTAVEAMLMDVPVVTMDFCNEIHNVDFIDAGATLHVKTPEALEEAVQKVLAADGLPVEVAENIRRHLQGTFLALDGQSSQRSATVIRELMRRGVVDA